MFVVSRSLRGPLEWNGRLLKGDVADAVAKLKQLPGEDILIYGSGELVSAPVPLNLIDEYRLMIFPVVLGTGKRLFRSAADKMPLRMTGTKTTTTGVVVLTYRSVSSRT